MTSNVGNCHTEINPGIVELLHQRGYRYYVMYPLIDREPEGDCLIFYEVRFFKTSLEAEIHQLLMAPRVSSGHISDEYMRTMSREGLPFFKFLVRDGGY